MASTKIVTFNSLIGLPGCGKGVHHEFIHNAFGRKIHVIEMGEIIRLEIAHRTDFDHVLENSVAAGKLVRNKQVFQLLGRELKKPVDTLFDGFPRNLAQAKYFLELTSCLSHICQTRVEPLIYLFDIDSKLAFEHAFHRNGVRIDSDAATIKKRIRNAKRMVYVLGEYFYKQNVRICNIDANINVKFKKDIPIEDQPLVTAARTDRQELINNFIYGKVSGIWMPGRGK